MSSSKKSYQIVITTIASIIIGVGIGFITGEILAWPLIGLGVGLFSGVMLSRSS